MKLFRVSFHCFLPSELPRDVFPVQYFMLRAENQNEAKSAAECFLREKCEMVHGFHLTEIKELKMYEISLRDISGKNNTTQYPEDWVFLPVKEKFFATSLEEAKEIAKTRETLFGESESGRVLQYGPTEVGE